MSNCVLNLVRDEDKGKVFAESFRVLRRGGRAVISDIVADEPVPGHLKNDPELWSGCVSGALEQNEFLRAFEQAGFYGIEILKRDSAPWRTVEGIEFRSITVRAFKGKQGACLDCNQAVIYRGPWRKVEDDDGHTLTRGQPMAVCEKTFRIYSSTPYSEDILPAPPLQAVAPSPPRSSIARGTPHAIRAKPRGSNIELPPTATRLVVGRRAIAENGLKVQILFAPHFSLQVFRSARLSHVADRPAKYARWPEHSWNREAWRPAQPSVVLDES